MANHTCETCGKTFKRQQSKQRFCTYACKVVWQRGRTTPLEDRLWKRVDKSGGPDACWEWQGYRTKHGYGQIKRGPGLPAVVTSRAAYEATYGPIPDGLHVLHMCDNPPCCNPAHLMLGTPKSNSDDKISKGRHAYGERHGHRKFTVEDIKAIRAAREAGVSGRYLARLYGVSEGCISGIYHRRTWANS